MKPVHRGRSSPDLFRERLDAIIDMRHGLVRLAGLVPWSDFDESFGKFFKSTGRPAKPTRLMVGLHYLKHIYDLSDEEVVERWVENQPGTVTEGWVWSSAWICDFSSTESTMAWAGGLT